MADNEFYRVDVVIDVQGEDSTRRSLNRTQQVINQTERRARILDRVKASPVVRVIDRATKPLNEINRKITDFTKKAAKKLAIFTTAAAVAVTGFAVASTNEFIKFEQGMNEVFTLMPGITQNAMDDMSKQTKQFSKDFGVLPDKVVPALYQSISAGVPKDNVFDFLAVAQKAAVGGVTELETAVDGITSVVNAYGADVVDAAKASDLMFSAVKLGKTNFQELSSSLYNVIPTASALGVEFGDVTAAMAAMTAQGTPTSVATTQMRQLFVELSKDGGKASKMFQEMSGKTFKQFIAEGNNVQDALQLMEKAADKTGVGVNDLFSSVEAGNAALALTGKGTEAFSSALDEMANSAGATDKAYERMEKGLGRSLEKIKANFKVLMIDVGEKLAPTVYELAQAFQDKLPAIQSVVERAADKIGTALKNIVTAGKGIIEVFKGNSDKGQSILEKVMPPEAAAMVVNTVETIKNTINTLMDVVNFIKENFDIIGPAIAAVIGTYVVLSFYAWAKAAWKAAAGTLAAIWPILAILAGVGLAVAGLMWVWKNNFGGIQEKTKAVIDFIKPYIEGAISFVMNLFGQIGQYIGEVMPMILQIIQGVWGVISAIWGFQLKAIFEVCKLVFLTILDIITVTLNNIWNVISTIIGIITGIFKAFLQIITGDFSGAWETIKQTFFGAIENIQKIFEDWIAGALKIGANFVDNIIGGFLSMWENLKQTASKIWDSVTGIFSKKSKVSVDVEAKASGRNVTETVTKYAKGGILTRPHIGMVAEAGPEAIIPLSSEKRQRATRLWEEAGRRLGMVPYADGGVIAPPTFPKPSPVGVGGGGMYIDVDADVDISMSEEMDEDALALKIGKKIVQEIKKAIDNKG